MTPDELVVIMLERLAKSRIDFTVESYEITRAAADRLLRTVGAVPEEPPKQIEARTEQMEPPQRRYVMPNPALASPSIASDPEAMPVYPYRRREAHSGS